MSVARHGLLIMAIGWMSGAAVGGPPAPGPAPQAACAQPEEAGADAAQEVVSLADDIEPFRTWFNSGPERPRFVAILSSTCGPCVSGAVTSNEAVVGGFAEAGIDVAIVWIDVLASDGAASATRASVIFDDPRVSQYHDPEQLVGRAFARGLLERPPAWDIYLFYPAGARWGDAPPEPVEWMHQLGGADKGRYKIEVALAASMHGAMSEHLGFEPTRPPPTSEQLAAARAAATARIGAAAACAAPGDNAAQCKRCAASGGIGQCAVSGWRYVVASIVRDEAGEPTNRFELMGAAEGPVELGEVEPTDTRRTYRVDGMACPDCAVQVAGKALQVRGVTRVEVDYDERRLRVYCGGEDIDKLDTLPMHLALSGFEVEAEAGE